MQRIQELIDAGMDPMEAATRVQSEFRFVVKAEERIRTENPEMSLSEMVEQLTAALASYGAEAAAEFLAEKRDPND